MRILIVEDEYNLADVVSDRLKKENYKVDIETDGEEGFYTALNGTYDLLILDVMLPHMNGFEILKEIRGNELDLKIIMLTAKAELEDKLNGLSNGADDYLTKPFHIEELIARVNIQLRKINNNQNNDYIELGNLRLNLKSSTISNIETTETLEIGKKEYELLEYFMNNKNQIISKDQIYTKIWGIDNEIESNNLEAYLSFIRKKLKLINSNVTIKVSRGLGYKLEVNHEETKN
jgi:DNA-binding response OmpR family regulator